MHKLPATTTYDQATVMTERKIRAWLHLGTCNIKHLYYHSRYHHYWHHDDAGWTHLQWRHLEAE
jgi:hypothetical protein